MTNKLKVTIAVVCYNEERNISDCLNSLLEQSYGLKNFEILVVDNNSDDGTQQLVRNFQKKHKNIKLVVNSICGIASSRNVALRQVYPKRSRGAQVKLLAFIDADCWAPKDWLKKLVAGYELAKKKDEKIVAVGGSNIPPSTTRFWRALKIFLNSFLGSGRSVQGRVYGQNKYVPHLPCVNVLYEKEKIEEVGGFDESFGSIIEDEDLSWRLAKRGYRFFYLANASITHQWVDNLNEWIIKMFVWGKGRAWFLKKHPERFQLIFLGPAGLALLLILLSFFSFLFYPLLIYFLVVIAFSIRGAFKYRNFNSIPYVLALYFTTHLFYGLGEIYGLFKRR